MIECRQMRDSDLEVIVSWWKKISGTTMPRDQIPINSTYVADIGGIPAIASTVFACKHVAWVHSTIGNPRLQGPIRKEAMKQLVEYFYSEVKKLGCNKVFALVADDKLKKHFSGMGFDAINEDLTMMMKES